MSTQAFDLHSVYDFKKGSLTSDTFFLIRLNSLLCFNHRIIKKFFITEYVIVVRFKFIDYAISEIQLNMEILISSSLP